MNIAGAKNVGDSTKKWNFSRSLGFPNIACLLRPNFLNIAGWHEDDEHIKKREGERKRAEKANQSRKWVLITVKS